MATLNLRPASGSTLINAGVSNPSSGTAYAISTPLFPPVREPVLAAIVSNAPVRASDAQIDIGAFEVGVVDAVFANGFEN